MDIWIVCVLALVPMIVQLWALNLYLKRVGRAIRLSTDRPPYTTAIRIEELGPEPRAITRLLDRATRLDQDEIDALIEARGGLLPLLMSHSAAQSLVRELRQLGAQAEMQYQP